MTKAALAFVVLLAACHHAKDDGPDAADGLDAAAAVTDGGELADAADIVDLPAVDGGPFVCGAGSAECSTDADCNDGDPTTVDSCQLGSGEFPVGTCLHAACDGGASCVNQAVDPNCASSDTTVVYPPFVTLYPPDVPTSCSNGFQLADAQSTLVYTVHANTSAGSRMLTLDLDIATYTAPDGVEITGVDGNCKQYTLFDTCLLKTSDDSEHSYTDGMHRPTDVAIRQYHLDLRPGTSQLTFNFGNVDSPMYIQVLGLCDFTLPTPPTGSVSWYAPVP